jgi:hypothetical protein
MISKFSRVFYVVLITKRIKDLSSPCHKIWILGVVQLDMGVVLMANLLV